MSLKFCSLSSGSSGNCYLAGSDNTYILIDAGISARKITSRLNSLNVNPSDISGILITHEHSDHISGIDVLSKNYGIPIFSNSKTSAALTEICKYSDNFIMHSFENNVSFNIGDLEIKAFPVHHDAADTVGFSVKNSGSKICTATDTGCVTDDIINEISDADLIILEANHDENILKMGRYPWSLKQRILSNHGHLSNTAAGEAILKIIRKNPKSRQILLAHLSKENNFPEMAYQTIINILDQNSIIQCDNLRINLLNRDEMSGVYLL